MPNEEVIKAAQQWLAWDRNHTTRSEVEELLKHQSYDKLRALLLSPRLEFGTAGLRAAMGAGYCRMNELTVIQTAQGLAQYLLEQFGDRATTQGVIIGFDARHNSHRFAELSAAVFDHAGIHVRLFRDITPTPFVPFGVIHFHCVAGVMVTASHNPKQDNGYKVYWENGAQIVPPHDVGIASAIERNLIPLSSSFDVSRVCETAINRADTLQTIFDEYFASLSNVIQFPSANAITPLRFTYTAMHGVGCRFTLESLKRFGFNLHDNVVIVKEQCDPDPDFPTVEFPNPEEGKSALDLSIRAANEAGSTIILANDPDADRLAVAEKDVATNTWSVLTGNEIGALLGWWAWKSWRSKNPNADPKRVSMLSSTVSSHFLATLAKAEGFHFEETLTGFKWMGSRGKKLALEGQTVIFAFEEAIGFMFGCRVWDKDGVTAAGVIAELATYLSLHFKRTLKQQLAALFQQYGVHVSNNSYCVSHDPTKTKEMFDALRSPYPSSIGRFQVEGVRDLTAGHDSRQPDHVPLLPVSSSSQMITFYLSGAVVTLRGSGTEPKIKWYSEVIQPPGASGSVSEAAAVLDEVITALISDHLRPQVYGFQLRK